MKFCPGCGNKIISETSQFCTTCGQKLPIGVSIVHDTEYVDTQQPKRKKKIKSGWIWFGIVVLFLSIGMGYGIYEDSIYPKSEAALESFLLNKYWSIQETTVKGVFVDGKKITDTKILEKLEGRLNDRNNKNQFFCVRKLNSGKLFEFDMGFDNDVNSYTYEVYEPNIKYDAESYRYVLSHPKGNPNSYFMSTGILVEDESEIEIKKYEVRISKITSTSMSITSEIVIQDDGQEIRMITEEDCELYRPPIPYVNRVNQEFKFLNELSDW